MAHLKAATILETCHVSPPPSHTPADQILPLTFLDLVWLHFHPTQRLLFYQFPCSTSHFHETIVPRFKTSLSLTLKHFFPLASHIIYPSNSQFPKLRHLPGHGVPVTIAEASPDSDFNYLTGNHPRDADEFYAFFTELPPPEIEPESGFKMIPVFTAQITLFPDAGFCIGFNNHHGLGDASSIVRFIKAWSLICRVGNDDEFLNNPSLLPVYDRDVVKDPSGALTILWNQMKYLRIESPPLEFPTNKLRATYVLKREDIEILKSRVRLQSDRPDLIHVSTFTVTTAYVWSCLVKAAAQSGEAVDDETELFIFTADARNRTNPPVPEGYFGNCVDIPVAESTRSDLNGELGFVRAAEVIGESIEKKVKKKEEVLRGAEEWITKFSRLLTKRLCGVAGSPRFDLYSADFGWGKSVKYEVVSIDMSESMSLSNSREFEGGLEIGLSLPREKLKAFATAFSSGLD